MTPIYLRFNLYRIGFISIFSEYYSIKTKGIKTSINPIKTLTPRFITRTLEKIKKN